MCVPVSLPLPLRQRHRHSSTLVIARQCVHEHHSVCCVLLVAVAVPSSLLSLSVVVDTFGRRTRVLTIFFIGSKAYAVGMHPSIGSLSLSPDDDDEESSRDPTSKPSTVLSLDAILACKHV